MRAADEREAIMSLQQTNAYREIEQLCGMDEFKAFARKLVHCAHNMEKTSIRALSLPNLIFATVPGCGVTLHIRLLTDLVEQLRLMPLVGDERFFEWTIDQSEESFDRLLKRIRRAAGFYGQFRGVVGLDISRVSDKTDAVPAMERLMEYVDATQGMILFVFIIPLDTSEQSRRQLLAGFSDKTPVELIRMPFPDDRAVLDYVCGELSKRGFAVAPEAGDIIRSEVTQMIRTPGFEGYQTLQNLTDEIVWRKVSGERGGSVDLTAEDVRFIRSANGSHTMLSLNNRLNRRVVGFSADRNA